MHAKPNLNGNTPEDFRSHGRAIFDAARELEKALIAARFTHHGRNYQTVTGLASDKRQADMDQHYKMERLAQDISEYGIAVYRAAPAKAICD